MRRLTFDVATSYLHFVPEGNFSGNRNFQVPTKQMSKFIYKHAYYYNYNLSEI